MRRRIRGMLERKTIMAGLWFVRTISGNVSGLIVCA
jgi:hypothetical protein